MHSATPCTSRYYQARGQHQCLGLEVVMQTSRDDSPARVTESKDKDGSYQQEPSTNQSSMNTSRVLRWLWVGAAISAASIVLLGTLLLTRPTQGSGSTQLLGTDLGGTPAPTFNLIDQNGKSVSLDQLRGHPIMLTFFDSVCPHTDCSLMANYVNTSYQEMASSERSRVIWLAISLNPWHDTPSTAKTFLTSRGVNAPIHFMLGSVSQLAPVWGDYHIQSVLQSNGVVVHTTGVYIIDQQGRERIFLDEGFDPDMLSSDLHLLLTAHPSVNAQQAAQTDGSVTMTKTVTGGTVTLQATPDAYGTYSYLVWVWDAKGQPLANGTGTLYLTMSAMSMQPLNIPLAEDSSIGPGIYRATGVLSMAGQWQAIVSASPAGATHSDSAIQATFTFTSKY